MVVLSERSTVTVDVTVVNTGWYDEMVDVMMQASSLRPRTACTLGMAGRDSEVRDRGASRTDGAHHGSLCQRMP